MLLVSGPMKRVLITDRQTYQLSSRRMTDEGYMFAPAFVARTGIQKYLASELGLKGRNPNEIINVYRPPEEVFNQSSLDSYEFKEITDNHPDDMVNADTYKELSVGQVVSKGVKDEDGEGFVRVDLLIKDSKAIEAVKSGKVELSPGYYADYIKESGTVDGIEYEFIQRNIAINHVALVDVARGGRKARIFDNQTGEHSMKKITLDNGRSVELEDTTAALVEDSIERLTAKAEEATKALEAKDAELQTVKATADQAAEDLKEAKAKTSDTAIELLTSERLEVTDAARSLVKDFDVKDSDGKVKSIDAIKLEVVTKLHPKRDFKDADQHYINAVFDMDMEKKKEEDEEEEGKKQKAQDSLTGLGNDLEDVQTGDAQQKRDKVRQDFLDKRYGKKTAKVED